MADFDRIYDILREQGETLARIDQSQQDTRERLFGAAGQPGALHFLQNEIAETKADIGKTNLAVDKHAKQIAFWRGALVIVGVIWTTLVAVGAALLQRK